jgi:cytochrome c oxidase subunit 2
VKKKSKPLFYLTLSLVLAQPTTAEELADGLNLFINNCSECHQRDGQGIEGIYPALVGSEIVTGSGIDIAQVLIIGRGEMPSFAGAMTPRDMAQIINYIRHAWSNGENLKTNVDISAESISKLLQK